MTKYYVEIKDIESFTVIEASSYDDVEKICISMGYSDFSIEPIGNNTDDIN